MKFIENIADSEIAGSIQRYIEKLFEALASAYDKRPELYVIVVAFVAVSIVGIISYNAGKRCRGEVYEPEEKKKHIKYDEIDWGIKSDSGDEVDESITEVETAPKTVSESVPEPISEPLPTQMTPPTQMTAPKVEPIVTPAPEPINPAPSITQAEKNDTDAAYDGDNVIRYLMGEVGRKQAEVPVEDNTSNKNEQESVKVEQINLIKAVPYRKFGPENRDTNRSGRIFTEEELMKQIRD